MSAEQRAKYDQPSEKEVERVTPQKIKIKHTFEGSDLKLDGYVYFAQKMRQTDLKGKKIGEVLL